MGAITDGYYRAHRYHRLHRYQAITDGWGMGSPEGEKFLRPDGSKRQSRAVQNLIQNYSEVLQDIGFFLKKAT